MEVTSKGQHGEARLARLKIAANVMLNVVLACVLAAGVIWLAGRPGLRKRWDLTINSANTLDANARLVIDNLQDPIEIDVFFRPFQAPLTQLGGALQERMFEILLLAEDYAPDKIKLTNHPYAAPGTGGAELLAAMQELRITESNLFVVSNGNRRVAMKLLGEVAEVDMGNPSRQASAYRPPGVVSFRGVETLVKALLRVTQGEKPLAIFATGHGERAIFETGDGAMGSLHTALVADGFRVETWNPGEDGAVPEDCSVLAIVGPTEQLSVEGTGWIADYVRRGGSLIAAPGLYMHGGQNSIGGILAVLGIQTNPGFVCRPVINAAGLAVPNDPRSAAVVIKAGGMRTTHPITEVLRRGDRRVRLVFSHIFERGKSPNGGVLLDILRTDEGSWLETLPPPGEEANYKYDAPVDGRPGERTGAFTVAMTSVFPVQSTGPIPVGEISRVNECRVLAVGTPELFANALFDVNRDFLLNSFNWAANREFRVSVTPLQRDDRRLDIGGDRTLFTLNLIAVWLLPLTCLGLALFTTWRRRH